MNTEFPNRLPIIQTTENIINRAASNNTASNTQPSEFEKTLLNIFQKSVKTLNSITDFVADLNTKISKRETKKAEKVSPAIEKVADEVRETRKDNKKNTEESNEHRFSFYKKITTGLPSLNNYWKDSVRSLTSTIENANSSLSSAIGSVFGSGIIGRTIGNVLNKSLSFFTSKILMGMVVSNLPAILKMTLIGSAIGYLIHLIVKYWDKIMPVIKWTSDAVDQGFDAIISILNKSKYEEARKNLAKEFGVKESDIKSYYGDTVRGRAQMLEDWKKIQEEPAYAEELRDFIKSRASYNQNYQNAFFGKLDDIMRGTTKDMTTIYQIQNTYGSSGSDSKISMERPFTEGGSISNPVITNVNNITTNNNAVSGLGVNNTSTAYPMSSVYNAMNNFIPNY